MVRVGFHTTHNGGNHASRIGNRDSIFDIVSKVSQCTASLFLDTSVVYVVFHTTPNGGNASRIGNQNFIIIIGSKIDECTASLLLDIRVVYMGFRSYHSQ